MSQGGVEVLMRLIIKLETSELDGNGLFASVGSYCQKIMDIAYNRYMFSFFIQLVFHIQAMA